MGEVKEYQRRLTYKGGVVIPVEVRRFLGVKPRGEVRFRITGKKVELLPPTMTLEETFASVKPKNRPVNFKRLRDAAVEEQVER
ncbi:MAG: AbrB/MazE/SpoVT family DNA-binding domain-containing protein [Chloroflexi bacterium]|nr:AbrB/MazE/SpoVT family DNA-binding domain-containing protein [Chloroflexota bacterium]